MEYSASKENLRIGAELILLDDQAADKAFKNKLDLYGLLAEGPSMVKKESIKYDYGIDNSNFDPSPFKIDLVNEEVEAEPSSINKSEKSIKCNCSKTKCQKNYCDCFKARKICGDECSCQGCFNNEPETFKFVRNTSGPTCKCLRRNCLKNYCECHSSGRKCTQMCKCIDCLNTQDKNQQLETLNKTKKKRIRKSSKVRQNISHNDC